LTWRLAYGLCEHAVELRIAAESCIQRVGQQAQFRVGMQPLKKGLRAQAVPIGRKSQPRLPLKQDTEIVG